MKPVCWFGLFLAASLAGGPAVSLAAAGPDAVSQIHVTIHDGLLTVDVRDAPLGDVVRVIGERTGVRVVILSNINSRVTEAFTRVPLEEGIKRLLRGHSLVLVYAPTAGGGDGVVLSEIQVVGSSPPLTYVQTRTDPDPADRPARLRAVRMLDGRRDAEAAADLIRVLSEDPDPVIRAVAATGLGRVRTAAAATALTAALADQAVSVRIQGVHGLRMVGGVGALGLLREVLTRDPDSRVRRAAARAVAELPGEDAAWVLQAATSDPDESVREEAAGAFELWQKRIR